MAPRSIGWMACLTVLVSGGCQSFSEATTPDAGAGDAGADAASGAGDGGAASEGGGGGGSDSGGNDGGVPCGTGVAIGTIGTFSGKVNVHSPVALLDDPGNRLRGVNGWYPDPDCATGADAEKVGYCRRFWPDTSDVVAGSSVPPENKPFLPSTCSSFPPSVGQAVYFCCKR